ncbi:response regulator [Chitinophaga sp.]|uniref:response regulator n=1 Tax=Chitinophaga sp. TaxID=1869181 RepID=UPI0031CF30A2
MATILIIEDNQEIRDNIAEILEMADYQVIAAADGKQGLMLAESKHPDLIVCDLTLPILDGFVVLQMLNKDDKPCKIPFIFLTARSERAEIRKGMDMGADDYITKPFDPSELLSAIECQLRKAAHARISSVKVKPLTTEEENKADEDPFTNLTKDRNIRTIKSKQIIYQEGNHPSCLYFILKGLVKTFRIDEEGKEFISGLYKEGEFLGYLPVLEKTRYSDTAEAIGQVTMAIIPIGDFEELTVSNRHARERIIRMLTHTIEEKEVQLLRVAYDSLRKRAADTLLTVFHKYNVAGDSSVGIKFSRGNLAAIAGVAKESFARTLADFKEEHLIDIKNGVIYLLDIGKLNQLGN